jgi:hypothetical protein
MAIIYRIENQAMQGRGHGTLHRGCWLLEQATLKYIVYMLSNCSFMLDSLDLAIFLCVLCSFTVDHTIMWWYADMAIFYKGK